MDCTKKMLYDPANEHDACGVGLIVNINGVKYHEVVENALKVLEHMAHRGAEGADSKTGDGAGIMVQIPHEFILLNGIPVPERGRYGVGMFFMPRRRVDCERFFAIIAETVAEEGLTLMHTRRVPVDSSILGREALAKEPIVEQIFISGDDDLRSDVALYERRLQGKLYVVGKKIERKVAASSAIEDKESCYIVSLSTRTVVYKGMLTSLQLRHYFPDLTNPYFTSALALVHSRFSTNTFPTWSLAQPFRIVAHNGEINTIKGNRLWMQTRESVLHPANLGRVADFSPIIQPDMSDSASLDNTVEFFVRSGLSLPHALAMLIPESHNRHNPMSSHIKGFYEYHSIFMEPWDGPAAVLFSDGRYAGGLLDRNGLRPCRYIITKSGMMIMASETGVLDVEPSQIREKGRLRPGKMIMVDVQEGRILHNDEIKKALAAEHPYREWLHENRVVLSDIKSGRHLRHDVDDYAKLLRVFGYDREDIENLLKPMARNKVEPNYAMGNDTPLPVLSGKPQRFFDYFRQQFAQVTNPPIDPLREETVMSLKSFIGAVTGNLLEPSPDMCKVVELSTPIISNTELDILKNLVYKGFRTITLDMVFPVAEGAEGMAKAVDGLCGRIERAVDDGYNYIIVSDKAVDAEHAPIPSLIALSALHHHLIKCRKRTRIALIVESGEVIEVMHIALLVGFGASAVNPYMAFATLDDLVKRGELQLDYCTAKDYYIQAINKGLLKVISKMGISTIRSYRGAKLFEAVGVSSSLLDRYFGGGVSKIDGIDLEDVAADVLRKHAAGFGEPLTDELENAGRYLYRKDGERHAWNPKSIAALRAAAQNNDYGRYREFVALAENRDAPMFIRDLMEVRSDREPTDISEVEPESAIVKRFAAGAMSFGALSKEAHEDIACAMNRLGATSNTGEGGELPERFTAMRDGVPLGSAVKQVASGRFGVTTEYLVNASEIQIKVAQGAKPGEGGQLPGFKVDEMIARTRHSIPGITLISPPPHHDIYSIEDLSQLIFDLKNVNPRARISVKLVAETGVGTIAAGVAKAKADTIVISGGDGGTGASPLSSVFHAGLPMELGLAEIQQTLMLNNLRGKVRVQTDGQMKIGRDVIVAALLGAEEYGFATALMVALGCIMDRKCHTNKCCAGIATQCAELRAKYRGSADYIVNYMTMLARDVREQLAAMGYRSLDEIIGRSDLLHQRRFGNSLDKIDLSRLLCRVETEGVASRWEGELHPAADNVIDVSLISATAYAVKSKMPVQLNMPISNTDRSVGAMLAGHITRLLGSGGLPDGTVNITFRGSAGQSFGAFLCNGIALRLEGDANDYLGKGLSGGRIAVVPPAGSDFDPAENIIAGNTILYGATSGEVFINGRVGERFCVRNSGALAVVEGVGDHCCEYMTGGRTVVLGETGRNFAAGMSGGIAYVWDAHRKFDFFCNMELVELTLVDNDADNAELRGYIERHYKHTGSPLAGRMLQDWQRYVREFIKVTPIEYKKILASVNNVAE
ncbi:MAG: glutamate synthase large subunit [Alistipes sp.]|nr:glutamate synthase large subunit [Alistipes sp.]